MRKSDASKSKGVNVVNVTLCGISLDVVSLARDENGLACPQTDAKQRRVEIQDCTINALFFNISEGKIEDWTGKGLSDLMSGIIRSAIDPIQTFTRFSSLSFFRGVRFAT